MDILGTFGNIASIIGLILVICTLSNARKLADKLKIGQQSQMLVNMRDSGRSAQDACRVLLTKWDERGFKSKESLDKIQQFLDELARSGHILGYEQTELKKRIAENLTNYNSNDANLHAITRQLSDDVGDLVTLISKTGEANESSKTNN